MSASSELPKRSNLRELAGLIKSRLSRIHDHISSDNPTQTNGWASELTECRRLKDRFEKWLNAYSPPVAVYYYDGRLRMDKKKDLFKLINKLYDVTTNLYLDTKNYAEDLRQAKGLALTDDSFQVTDDYDLISTSSDDEPEEEVDVSLRRDTQQEQAKKRLQSESEADRRKRWAGKLLKIAHQLYQFEKFNYDTPDFNAPAFLEGSYRPPADDQEDQDVTREVYQVLGGLDKLKEIREETHEAALPMRDWEKRLDELVNASLSSS